MICVDQSEASIVITTNQRPVLPPVSDVGGQVGDHVHVADDEAVLSQQVLQHGLVSRGEVEHLQLETTVRL